MIDLKAVRADTMGCRHTLHFDNAGAALMPTPVFDAVQHHLRLERFLGGQEAARRSQPDLEAFYHQFAGLLNAQPEEIAYLENATRAWDMAFYGLRLEPGDRIITHGSEYASNFLGFLHLAKKKQVEIDIAPSDRSGQLDVEALERLITAKTRVIAITHVPTQGGLVNPAERVGDVARRYGLIYILDACQSVGQIDVDVEKIGCHVLTGTGRKFLRGPRGTGFLYMQRDLIKTVEPPFIDLKAATWTEDFDYVWRDDARKFENWESNVAGRVGLAHAVEYARGIGMKVIEERVQKLGAALRTSLKSVPGVQVCDLGEKKCGIVTFKKEGIPSSSVAEKLREQAMNVSVSSVEYARLDLGARGTGPVVRASAHYYNSEQEVETFVAAVANLK